MQWNVRTKALIGEEAVGKLEAAHVAVFGVGGVGGYAVEALVRAGVGAIDVIDGDVISESNLNRQIIATRNVVGQDKVEVIARRISSINPQCQVTPRKMFFLPENSYEFDFSRYDYVIDAVDTVAAKVEIILKAKEADVPVISAMGAGNKLDANAFEITDIEKTAVCPLAKAVRVALKKHNVKGVKAIFSRELPKKPQHSAEGERVPASISYVPAVMGLLIAEEVIKDLTKIEI